MKRNIIFLVFFILVMATKSYGAEVKQGIDSFPEDYRIYLELLNEKHPNWVFNSFYTGLDYNEVINNEYGNNRNLVPITYNDRWKSKDERII